MLNAVIMQRTLWDGRLFVVGFENTGRTPYIDRNDHQSLFRLETSKDDNPFPSLTIIDSGWKCNRYH